jgi:hypothetical protein
VRGAGGDHLVRLLEREAERLLDDDVLPGFGRLDREPRVQVVGEADVDDVALAARERRGDVGIPAGDAVLLRERPGVLVASGVDADYLCVRNEAVIRLRMNISDESCAREKNFDPVVRSLFPHPGPNG